MVRHEAYRTRKYDAKIDPDAIRSRFLAHKDTMLEQVEAKFAELVLIETKAKMVCEEAGVPTYQIPAYLNFARQCYRISKQFTQATQINETYFRYSTWLNRGLNATILSDIARLCGVDLTEYPAP